MGDLVRPALRYLAALAAVTPAMALDACANPPVVVQARASAGVAFASQAAPQLRPSVGGSIRAGLGGDRGALLVGAGGDWENANGAYRFELTAAMLPRWTPQPPARRDRALPSTVAWQTNASPSWIGGEFGVEWGERFRESTSGLFLGVHAGPLFRLMLSPQRHHQLLLGLDAAGGYQDLGGEPGGYVTLRVGLTWHLALSVF